MMPKTLTFIRHGESESNKARSFFEANKKLPGVVEMMRTHTSERRLTPKGVRQAQAAGAWMRGWMAQEVKTHEPVRLYSSQYVRAAETAGHLGLPGTWRLDERLVERNWGMMDHKPYEQRIAEFGEQMALRKEHAFFWRPADGETMQEVLRRTRDLINTLHRECADDHVICVSHGETMWTWRFVLEYWLPQHLREHMLSKDKQMRIVNCRIIQYSRVGPDGHEGKRLHRVRFIDPMHPDDPARNRDWVEFRRPFYSSEDLLAYAHLHPRFIPEAA